jgi:TRAP-type C4-dicarboxylate transport system permease large subunit
MWLDQRLRQYGGVLPTLALPTHTPLLVLVGRMILAMGIGLFAPPFGVGYYAACAIGRVDPAEGIRPIWGYLLPLLVGLIVVAIFPWIFDRVPASAYAMGGGR